MFGVGEIYLGRRLRGAAFLFVSGLLYACLVCAAFVPSLAYLWEYLPSGWGIPYCLLLFDIFLVEDQVEEEMGR